MDFAETNLPMFRTILLIQAGYYLVTAAWPLIHMPSFLRVTGSKNDLWLVRTVAALILVVGVQILAGLRLNDENVSVVLFSSIGAIIALTAIDVIYVVKRTLSPIYLADAALECLLLFFLLLTWNARL